MYKFFRNVSQKLIVYICHVTYPNIYYEITLTSIDQVTKMGIEPL